MSEEYSVGYQEGFDAGRNQAIDECAAEVTAIREQVEKLTAERDTTDERWMAVGAQREGELMEAKRSNRILQEQLAALAEQNEKMRTALQIMLDQFDPANHMSHCLCEHDTGYQCSACYPPHGILEGRQALSLPNLASPVLNRIRAEGMRMAADICATSEIPFDIELWASSTKQEMTAHTANALAEMLRAKADELEKVQ